MSRAFLQSASIPLALAFTVRPSNAISILLITIFMALHRHACLLPFIAALFFPFARSCDAIIQSFARVIDLHSRVRVFRDWRNAFVPPSMELPLGSYLAAIVVLHAILISLWWLGHCY